MTEFRLWGTDHISALVVIGALGLLVIFLCRRLRESRKKLVGYFLGTSLAAYTAAIYYTLFASGTFDPSWALPLELCHWVLIATVVALFTHNRLASEIAYFWGLGGTLQAIATPDLLHGFPSWDFIFFFWGHGATVVGILFLIAAGKFRPSPRSIIRVFLALNLYAALAGTIDFFTGWNYGYLRHKPETSSLLDYLGPWPWYLLSLEAFALAIFIILILPWRLSPKQ
jgi:hypothetical integral membrane protein (TIGR02206 family)